MALYKKNRKSKIIIRENDWIREAIEIYWEIQTFFTLWADILTKNISHILSWFINYESTIRKMKSKHK